MIASQKIGKSFMGALNYNLKKVNHPDPAKRAVLLDTNFANLDKRQVAFEVDLVKQLRPTLNKYVYHTSLNFHKDDFLNDQLLLKVAHEYLAENGFNNNQYFIFRHYDADHPHLHLLVNRITFDGEVVSDSNNYKRSEQVLRNLERKYGLIKVDQSSKSDKRAVTKNEIAKIIRTGKVSDKMLLQEIMKFLISNSQNISELITNGEKSGVHFLFSQQSTGRISGITYFFKDYKTTGQKLGNHFKWAELTKQVNYDQKRDGMAITEANARTRAKYGDFRNAAFEQSTILETEAELYDDRKSINEKTEAAVKNNESTYQDNDIAGYQNTPGLHIQISDDVDDEKTYGKSRRKRGR